MERGLLQRVRTALQRVLPQELTLRVESRDLVAPTFTVTVGPGLQGGHRFVMGWAGEGWPADVRRLASLAPEMDVAVARDLSVGAREWLTERRIGWVDELGRANVTLPSGLILIREVPQPRTRGPTRSDRWSPATVAAAEAVLSGIEPRIRAIQEVTGYSRGAVAKALSHLARLGLLTSDTARGPFSGRRVADPAALLDQYADAVASFASEAPRVLLHRLWADPMDALVDDLAPALDASGVEWAATGRAASILMAPYLSRVTIIELYVSADLFNDPQRLAAVFDARDVERGHRIEAWPLPSPVTSRAGETFDGVRCAPAARVYADLRAMGGRAAEAAHHLREVLHVGTDS